MDCIVGGRIPTTERHDMSKVIVQGFEYSSEQPPVGFVTLTTLDSDRILYGVFASVQEAAAFGGKLVNATVVPIYQPSLH